VLRNILIALVLVVLLLAVVIALQPSTFRVSRAATMAAAPPDVFAQVNDFHRWRAWAVNRDPAAKVTFEGPAAGAGAVFRWLGNSEVGEGSMTIVDSQPPGRIRLTQVFVKPFAGSADMLFEFTPVAPGTAVTWTVSGENNFVSKAFCLFMGGMDRMIAPDLEKGLAQLKAVVEGRR
jgi:hypothetical protein